jgi:hypothetical protein
MKAISDRTGRVRIVATFGDAQLVRHNNARYELRGGSPAEHADAIEWVSLFLHEAAVSFPPPVRKVAFWERTINVAWLNIRHSGRAVSPVQESRKPWVNVFGNEDLNTCLAERKPLRD